MPRPDWDEVWLRLSHEVGERSRCVRGKIGCVLVSSDNRVIAASYVGPPPKFLDANANPESTCIDWCQRAQPDHEPQPGYEDCVSSHAEQNAVARADYTQMQGGTAYVNGTVCWQCAKLLSATGISRVVMIVRSEDSHRIPGRSINFLRDNGIEVTVL